MAKRIQVKGKAPRGLSKATRQIDAAQEALDRSGVHMSVRSPKRSDAELAKIAGLGRGITKPSSTRKKLVKEGNPKFIGPRTKHSEDSEYIDAVRGKDDPYRGYKKRHRRENEIVNRILTNPIVSLKGVVDDRIGRAKDILMAPPGANRSTQRARAAELITAARKLKDPKTRAKVLRVIRERLNQSRMAMTYGFDEEIPF